MDKLQASLSTTKFFNAQIISGGKQYFLNSLMLTFPVVDG